MVQSGLYVTGSDPEIDAAISAWPALDTFVTETSESVAASFARLAACLGSRPPKSLPAGGGARA
jgi:flagellum-specific ATP synthase